MNSCCICQSTSINSSNSLIMQCQHTICINCLKTLTKYIKKPPIKCPICETNWIGEYRTKNNNFKINLPIKFIASNKKYYINLLRGPMKALGTLTILMGLMFTSIFHSSNWVLFTGTVTTMLHQLKAPRFWISGIAMLVSLQSWSYEPFFFSLCWDIVLNNYNDIKKIKNG